MLGTVSRIVEQWHTQTCVHLVSAGTCQKPNHSNTQIVYVNLDNVMFLRFKVLENSTNPDQTAPIPMSDRSYNQIILVLYPDQTTHIPRSDYSYTQIRLLLYQDQTAPIPRSYWSYTQIILLLYPDQTASITDCSYNRLQIGTVCFYRDQSDHGVHCLTFCLHLLEAFSYGRTSH